MENRGLAQDLLLLGLDPAGRVAGRRPASTSLAGAVLLDLALAERIDVVDKRVVPLDPSRVGDPVLDEISRGNWASEAVRAAVREVQSAMTAAVTAVIAAGAASG